MSAPRPAQGHAAVVLAGGTAARLGGTDKASIEVDGLTLLERALSAVRSAEEVVVVGDELPTSRPVTWAREDPPGGGPAAGLLAGIDALQEPAELVCVLACDVPRVTDSTIGRLLDALGTSDAAVLVDGAGRRQTLVGVYRCSSLVAARPVDHEEEHGLPVQRLVDGLRFAEVEAIGDEARDVDTWEDLRQLRHRR